jgi:hypothetical protein
VWALGSGCSTFYNSTSPGDANSLPSNTKMSRYYDEDRFEIHAIADIKADEELTHTYKSIKWRECFQSFSGH